MAIARKQTTAWVSKFGAAGSLLSNSPFTADVYDLGIKLALLKR